MYRAQICLIYLAAFGFVIATAYDGEICKLFSNNTVIRDPDSCGGYITCINFKSQYDSCSSSKPFFDKNTGQCVKSLTDDSACEISCANATGQFVADPTSCYGYYYCADEDTPQYGRCNEGAHFNATRQVCTKLDESACTTYDFDYCSIVKNDTNFDDVQSCDQYHTCSKKTGFTTNTCKNMYYDAISGTCMAKSLVKCDNHPLPANVCGKASKPLNNQFVSDGATCRGYFYCAEQPDKTPDPNPAWNYCGADKFFDASTQSCRDPTTVVCSEDRCDGRTLQFVVSGTKGCRHYLHCVDGVTANTLTCGNDFFNEENGHCTTQIITYAACAK